MYVKKSILLFLQTAFVQWTLFMETYGPWLILPIFFGFIKEIKINRRITGGLTIDIMF
jgi:hypothetical protein